MFPLKKVGYIREVHILRAFACMMILMIHVTAAFFYMHGENHTTFSLLLNQMTRWGTCLFVMISGFLLFYHAKSSRFDLKHFLFSRTIKAFFPFLFWSCFYLYLQFQTGLIHSFQWDIDFFFEMLFLGDGFYHLWFISIVIQFYILFPFLQYLIKDTKKWIIALFVSLGIQIFFVIKLQDPNQTLVHHFQWDKAYVFNWIFYFILAGYIAHHWEQIQDWTQKHVKTLVISSLIILSEALWSLQSIGSLSETRLANLVGTPILMLTVISLYPKMRHFIQTLSGLNVIGRYSMGIYLVHPFLLYFNSILPPIFWEPSMIIFTYLFYLAMSILLLKGIQQIPFYQYVVPIPEPRKKDKKSSENIQLANSSYPR